MKIETVYWKSDGTKIRHQTWKLDGKTHRVGGPAMIVFYESGEVRLKEWVVDGKRHRTDGPAKIQFYRSGAVRKMVWFFYGNMHRVDGPSFIRFNESGKVEWKEWALWGKVYLKSNIDLIKEMLRMRLRRRAWVNHYCRMGKSRELIEWFYGPDVLGGRKDRGDLRKFVMNVKSEK